MRSSELGLIMCIAVATAGLRAPRLPQEGPGMTARRLDEGPMRAPTGRGWPRANPSRRGCFDNPTFSLGFQTGNARNYSNIDFSGLGTFCGGLGGNGSGGGRSGVGHR